MNSRERTIAALERRVPDRVPYFECVIDPKVMQALLPGCDYWQFSDWIGLDNASQNRSSWSRENVEMIGNIDCGYLLCQASVEEVRRVTRETIAVASPGGGFCLSSSSSIHSSMRPENYLGMIETLRDAGGYAE